MRIFSFVMVILLVLVVACTPKASMMETEAPTNTVTITAVSHPEATRTSSPVTPTTEQTPTTTKTPENDRALKVLFIGNSYTAYNDLPEMFEELMISGGYDVKVEQSVFGGWSLSNHASSNETRDKIVEKDWDYVILQEQSVINHPEIGMYPAIRELNALVNNVGGKTILFMTWGRRNGLQAAGYPDFESMQAEVAKNYARIAKELGLRLAPVGLVWQETLAENPDLKLWDADGSHPSVGGTYLAACVFYAILAGDSPEGLDYQARLPEDTAQFLQRVVSESILGKAQDSQAPKQGGGYQPKIKKRVDIGGYQLFIHCLGTGNPAVILEAGWNDVSETWSLVQPDVAEHTRVCSYDRAGLGNSSPAPEPRSALKEIEELHTLLKNAGVKGPFIFVGHSWGGILVRLYAARYEEEIAGLILVDSSHPDMYRRNLAALPPESLNDSDSLRFYRDWFSIAIDDPAIKVDIDLFKAGSLDDLPLVVLTVPHKQRADDFPDELSDKFDENWIELHQELAQLSSNSRHIFIENSSHFIQRDQPDVVIEVVLEMVEQLR